uniref:Uncharacterized protein n=1 Tax=Avena sativa TaxID=4498 RepID=A0ACD5W358_AVESA
MARARGAFLLLLLLAAAVQLLALPANVRQDDPRCQPSIPRRGALAVYPSDMEQLQFLLNAKFIEAEWFLHAALGRGIDRLDRNLSAGGPAPIGARRASLDFRTTEIAAELGYQELGHIRAIRNTMGGFPRPAIDLSADRFAAIMDDAMGTHLDPPFDAYNSTANFLLASYILPHVTAAATAGIAPSIMGYNSKRLLASILAVEAGQDAVIRMLLYQRADETVAPYRGRTVAEFTRRISDWRNGMSGCGAKDEGVKRTPAETLRILYGSRNEQVPGGFLPRGANGTIARGFFQLA